MKQHGYKQPKGIDLRADTTRKARPARPRDDLKGAFAGSENKGPARHHKPANKHGTKTKEREPSRGYSPEYKPGN